MSAAETLWPLLNMCLGTPLNGSYKKSDTFESGVKITPALPITSSGNTPIVVKLDPEIEELLLLQKLEEHELNEDEHEDRLDDEELQLHEQLLEQEQLELLLQLLLLEHEQLELLEHDDDSELLELLLLLDDDGGNNQFVFPPRSVLVPSEASISLPLDALLLDTRTYETTGVGSSTSNKNAVAPNTPIVNGCPAPPCQDMALKL